MAKTPTKKPDIIENTPTVKPTPAGDDTMAAMGNIGDTIEAPASDGITVEEAAEMNLFNGADPAKFDRDKDGFVGGSLAEEQVTDEPVLPGAEGDPPLEPTEELLRAAHAAPSVPRLVQYFANSVEGPYAAVITQVNGFDSVHLTVLKPAEIAYAKDVLYVDDLTGDGPCWRWPEGSGGPAPMLANIGSIETAFPGATGEKVFGSPKADLHARRKG